VGMYTWVMFGKGGFGGRFLHSPETFQLYIRNIMYIPTAMGACSYVVKPAPSSRAKG
jgi:hypothetical protein